jgi:hypothetical protein
MRFVAASSAHEQPRQSFDHARPLLCGSRSRAIAASGNSPRDASSEPLGSASWLATQRSSEGFANRDQAPGRPRARSAGCGSVRRAETTGQEAADPILQAAVRRRRRFVDAWEAERSSSRLQGWHHAVEDRATVRGFSLGRTEGTSRHLVEKREAVTDRASSEEERLHDPEQRAQVQGALRDE